MLILMVFVILKMTVLRLMAILKMNVINASILSVHRLKVGIIIIKEKLYGFPMITMGLIGLPD